MPQHQADAVGELARFALHHNTEPPDIRGEVPQTHIAITLDELETRGRARLLDHNKRLAPAALRRLLCDYQAIPHTLRSTGQTLDTGRASRKIPQHLHRAITIRNRRRAFPACTHKPAHRQAHHMKPWTNGGKTKLNNLTLVCLHHHRMIHERDWHIHMGKHRPNSPDHNGPTPAKSPDKTHHHSTTPTPTPSDEARHRRKIQGDAMPLTH